MHRLSAMHKLLSTAMHKLLLTTVISLGITSMQAQKLVWHDEFNAEGPVDTNSWNFEKGFVRNHEYQWYQEDNAYQTNGILILEGRIDSIANPHYNPDAGNRDWRTRQQYARYSSASINTRGKFEFLYGKMEVRARIPAVIGAWPAIWLLGSKYGWPSSGEIDVMEYYHINGIPHILANACWGGDNNRPVWNSKKTDYKHFLDKDPYWSEKFHTWTMDWTSEYIRIYLDGELLNDIDLTRTVNGNRGGNECPFHTPQYILLNLAIGGDNGGEPVNDAFPLRYEIDYVRVYQ